ncbi:hypothetical protein FACS189429_5310 [Bacteroidia bacterium]|nr:hypothetical protein FACS189429_5310 [Bacteroidia bacterium]
MWYSSSFSFPDFSAKTALSQSHLLQWQGDSLGKRTDKINGYPALQIDSGGWFVFESERLLARDNALFLIVFEPSADDYLLEFGLWSLHNGSQRKRFLTSMNVGDNQINTKYNYFPVAGPNVTTNYVHFDLPPAPSERGGERVYSDTVQHSEDALSLPFGEGWGGADTIFIGRVDSLLFRGKLAEFLIIDTVFSEVQRQIWQSYLALKYGVTMYRGNYLNAAGDTLWHYDRNIDFTAGVGGIGRDDSIFLAQHFSRIYGDSVKIALHGYINDMVQNAVETGRAPSLQNGEYVFWGHNSEPAELSSMNYFIENDFYNFYQRRWKVKPVLQTGKTLDFQLTSPQNLPQGDLSALRLLVAKTADFNALETSVYTPNVIDNQKITFSNISLAQTADSTFYFTFGKSTGLLTDESANGGNTTATGAAAVFTAASYLPNPVIDNLTIDYRLTRPAVIWFSVHNNIGTPFCQTPPANRQAGVNQTVIPMSHLMTGTYTVYIHVDDMVMAQVVIKQ